MLTATATATTPRWLALNWEFLCSGLFVLSEAQLVAAAVFVVRFARNYGKGQPLMMMLFMSSVGWPPQPKPMLFPRAAYSALVGH